MQCKEVYILRAPYQRYGACLNALKKAIKDVFGDSFTGAIVEDILANEAGNHKPTNWECDFLEKSSKACEGLTVEECIKKTGEYEYKEWCFSDPENRYKYGFEVDCGIGLIYVYYCEEGG